MRFVKEYLINTRKQKMIELSNTQQSLEAQIAEEEAKTILPLKEARVISFLKNYTEIVKCADKAESLDNMKQLFDVLSKKLSSMESDS